MWDADATRLVTSADYLTRKWQALVLVNKDGSGKDEMWSYFHAEASLGLADYFFFFLCSKYDFPFQPSSKENDARLTKMIPRSKVCRCYSIYLDKWFHFYCAILLLV